MLDTDQSRKFYEDWHEILKTGYIGENIEEHLEIGYPEGDDFVLAPHADRSLQAEATAEIWLEIANMLDGELERDTNHLKNNFKTIHENFRHPEKETFEYGELQQSRFLLDMVYIDKDLEFQRELDIPVAHSQMPVGEYKTKVLNYTSNVRKAVEEKTAEDLQEKTRGGRKLIPAFLQPIFQ